MRDVDESIDDLREDNSESAEDVDEVLDSYSMSSSEESL